MPETFDRDEAYMAEINRLEGERDHWRRIAAARCPLVHVPCGACGHEIRENGTCGCEDNRHPSGPGQETIQGRLADALNRLRPVVDELRDQYPRLEQLYKEYPQGTAPHSLAAALLDALAEAARKEAT